MPEFPTSYRGLLLAQGRDPAEIEVDNGPFTLDRVVAQVFGSEWRALADPDRSALNQTLQITAPPDAWKLAPALAVVPQWHSSAIDRLRTLRPGELGWGSDASKDIREIVRLRSERVAQLAVLTFGAFVDPIVGGSRTSRGSRSSSAARARWAERRSTP